MRLDVRVTSQERATMHAMAKRRRMNLSEFLRGLVAEEQKRDAERARMRERWGGT